NQHFNRTVRSPRSDQSDGVGKHGRPAVGQFVPIDRCDHRMTQSKRVNGFSDATRLLLIERQRPAGFDRTVVASSGGDLAENQKCGGSGVPAFPPVGTTGFFTDGVELQAVDGVLDVQIIGTGLRLYSEPARETFPRCLAQPELCDGYQLHPDTWSRWNQLRMVAQRLRCGGGGSEYSVHDSREPR